MNIEEAIKQLSYDDTAYGGKCTEEVRKAAIEALEKQISYEVVNEGDKFEEYGICKCGGCAVNQFSMLYNYCPK